MNTRVSAAALVAAAIATLSACNSTSKSTSAPASPTDTKVAAAAESATSSAAPTSSAASTSAPAAAAASAKSINICAAIPPATVVQLTGKPYTVAATGTNGVGVSCAYDDVDYTDNGVTLSYATSNAETTWQAVHTGNITDISGVGDKAFWDNENTLYAVSGSTIIQVNGLSAEAPTVALAKALLNALH